MDRAEDSGSRPKSLQGKTANDSEAHAFRDCITESSQSKTLAKPDEKDRLAIVLNGSEPSGDHFHEQPSSLGQPLYDQTYHSMARLV